MNLASTELFAPNARKNIQTESSYILQVIKIKQYKKCESNFNDTNIYIKIFYPFCP